MIDRNKRRHLPKSRRHRSHGQITSVWRPLPNGLTQGPPEGLFSRGPQNTVSPRFHPGVSYNMDGWDRWMGGWINEAEEGVNRWRETQMDKLIGGRKVPRK